MILPCELLQEGYLNWTIINCHNKLIEINPIYEMRHYIVITEISRNSECQFGICTVSYTHLTLPTNREV